MSDARQLKFMQIVSALAFQSSPASESAPTVFGVSLFGLSVDGVAYSAIWDRPGQEGRVIGWKALSMDEVDEDGAPIMVDQREDDQRDERSA